MNFILIFISLFVSFFVKPVVAVDYPNISLENNEQIYVESGTPIGSFSIVPIIPKTPTYEDSSQQRHASTLVSELEPVYEVKEDVVVELFNADANSIETVLTNDKNEKIVTQIDQTDQQGITTLTISPPSQLKPGKYTLEITDQTGSKIEQNFLWGVLAINPNKSVYRPGETADLAIAVLNEKGEVVCDAKVILKITDPNGKVTELSTENSKIIINQTECNSSKFTLKPDYQASFSTLEKGKYLMELTGETRNGIYTINDSFDVQSAISFDVERISATRIYPPNNYPVNINLKISQDFQGDIYEEIPASFEIINPGNNFPKFTVESTNHNTKKIKWSVDLKKGELIKLQYQYKAPNISPQFYLIGPLQLIADTNLVYQESRQWQIASDAVTDTIVADQDWVVPDGVSSIIVEAWGGGGGGGGGGGSNKNGGGGGAGGQYSKKTLAVSAGTTYAVVVGAGGVGPQNGEGGAGYDTVFGANLVVAKGGAGGQWYDTGGAGGIGTTALGVGDTVYKGGNGAAGASSYSGGGGGGAGTTGAGVNASGMNLGTGTTAYGGDGGQGVNGNSTAGNNGSPYGGGGSGATKNGTSGNGYQGLVKITYTVVVNQPPSAPTNSTPGNGSTAVDVNPTLTSSSFSDPDGSDTHTASQWQIASDSNFSSVVWDSGTTNALTSVNVGYTLSTSTLYFWHVRHQDNHAGWSDYSIGTSFTTVTPPQAAPSIPTLISPADTADNQSVTPTFQFVATDSNNDTLLYELKYCTDSNMSVGCSTFTAADVGWSGADVGTSAYSSGTTATYILQVGNSLAENTTYFWKTRAIDPGGTNTWSGTQASPYSLTTGSRPNTPTLVSPGTGTTAVSLTPSLVTVTTDANSDPLQYKIDLCTNSAMTTGCTTYTAADSGWSGADIGTSSFSSGTTATYVLQSSLNVGTSYFWRSYAVDYDGLNRWSATQGTPYSFVTNQVPSTPTLTSPANSAVGISLTPSLSIVTTDPESDPMQYKIILATNASFTGTTQTFDQTVSNTGWSNQDIGTSAYASGTTATYILQSNLEYSTLYYWKTQAKDYSGSNTWSSLSIGYSFTTYTPPQEAPSTPTLIIPADTATSQHLTPTFKTVTTDANNDNLQYEIKICDDSGMTGNCTIVTAANVGWSGADIGTSSFSSGTTAVYILQIGNSLTENSTYYWKTRAIDPAGANTWSGTQTTPYSFTTNSRPSTPILVSPGTGTTAVSQTPAFQTVTTDPNSDAIQYKIELATNDTFTGTTQTFDLSSSSVGWSGIDVGTSAYASGTTATYTISAGSSLAVATTYYWRTSAKDPVGTNRWSSVQGTPNSFTTIGPILSQATFRWSADDADGESRGSGVGDTWYDENYDYRAPLDVVNQVASTLTDFQVRLILNTSTPIGDSKMQADCDDIRITDSDKSTPLNYWIQSGCNTTTTQVWVKVPSLAASVGTTLYVYYGNPDAAIASNGDNTFDIFDDFTGSSIDTDKWHVWNPHSWSTLNVSGGTLAITGASTGGAQYAGGFLSNSTFSFSNHVIEANARWTMSGAIDTNGYLQSNGVRITDQSSPGTYNAGNQYYFNYQRYNGLFNVEVHKYEFHKFTNGTYSAVTSSSLTNDNPANFEIVRTNWYAGPNERAFRSTNNGDSFSSLWTSTDSLMSLPTSRYFGYAINAKQGSDGSTTAFLDWLRVRKYAATEPTTTLGTETTMPPAGGPSGATWLAAENVGITGVNKNENIRLRFSLSNTGETDTLNFRLQVAPLGASAGCTGVPTGNFVDVETSIGSNVAVMTTSPHFTNQETTTNQLTDSSTTFVAGNMVEYNSNQTNDITLTANQFTEAEYNFQMTTNAGGNTAYCFRVVDINNDFDTYTQIAQLTTVIGNNPPGSPYLPYVNNTTAQSGQQTPVYGLIDHTPAFSAVFDDADTSDTASNYQLQIGSDTDWGTAEIWDSTKSSLGSTCNENSRCADIIYSGGTPLTDGSTYYWRIKFWDNSDTEGSWSSTQQFSMNSAPTVSDVILNNNSSIDLSENSSIGISWVSTVTDLDGYTNLSSATGKVYRSGVGASCSPDNNNCYSDASCDFYDCADNSCSALCSADIYFFAEATDTGSTFVDQYWQAFVQATDIRSEVGSTISSSTTVDVNTMSAFSITSSLVYGEVFAGSDTGSSNTITTVTNTGNSIINLEITGDYMCTDYPSCGGQSIEPQNQQYNLDTFVYGNGTTLSTSPSVVNIGISKPTQTPSNSSRNLYWGIGIPISKDPGNYQGSTTILVY